MVSRWWDPGDLGVRDAFSHREGFGLEVWRFALILRWFGLKRDKGIREKLRNYGIYGILGDLLAISILRKMVSQRREGNIFDDCQPIVLAFLMEIRGINYRGDGGTSRSRGARREETRSWEQEGHSRFPAGQTKEHHDRSGSGEKDRDEGEIMNTREASAILPSHQIQLELSETQARGTNVISDPIETEKGLQAVKCLVEEKPDYVEDDYVMGMDGVIAAFLEFGIDMDATDDLDDVTEEEMKELTLVKEDVAPMVEAEERAEVETERGPVIGEVAKQQRTRKRIFKPTGSAVGSTKMRIANALVKRAAAKATTRQGAGRKQQESKGASIPKSGNFKV